MSAVPPLLGLDHHRPHPLADAAAFDFTSRLAEMRGGGVPSLGGFCRSDGVITDIQPLTGDFDVDPPLLEVILAHVVEASVGEGSRWGTGAAVAHAAVQGRMQRNARLNLQRLHDRVASGAIREISISKHMTLYNANERRGRPRVRVRITNMPVTVLAPIGGARGWRTNRAGTTHSAAWQNPSSTNVARASAMAGEMGWNSRLGWLTGRTGTGILTFAPQAIIDARASLEWVEGADGEHHRQMNWRGFAVRSARSQSGNAFGLAVGTMATSAVTKSSLALGAGFAVAGAPVVLIGLVVGIMAVVAWNISGAGNRAGELAQNVLER